MGNSTDLASSVKILSWQEISQYLYKSGRVSSLVKEIQEFYILEHAFLQLGIEATDEDIQNTLANFMKKNRFKSTVEFRQWLTEQNKTEISIREEAAYNFKLVKLKEHIYSSEIDEFWIDNWDKYRYAILSWISVSRKALADEIFRQVKEGTLTFEQAALEDSCDDIAQSFRRKYWLGSLPNSLKMLLDEAKPGHILEPVQLSNESSWYIYRFDLLENLNRADRKVRDDVFQHWLNRQLENSSIRLPV